MANQLDELDGQQMPDGLDTQVIAKRIPAEVGTGSLVFEVVLWCCGIVPGVVFLFKKIGAKNYFQQLEQKIQRNASQVDNYLEQRVVVLQNCAKLLDRAVDLDKTVFAQIAKLRSGITDEERNEYAAQIDAAARNISVAVERYPELKAHGEIEEAMKQNLYLQKEITAARSLYNDSVDEWNRAIFKWPTKQIVAARNGYTTRIPFVASSAVKEQAREVFF